MRVWTVPVVIEPELKAWVFGGSPQVAEILGWTRRRPYLRKALEWQGLRNPEDPKRDSPKKNPRMGS